MRFYKRIIAAAAVFALLCGCSNNTASSTPEENPTAESSAPTAEAPQVTKEQPTAPGGVPADASSAVSTAETAPEATNGVDLDSGKYSENSLIFDLNGTFCDVSELPFSVETFKPNLSINYGNIMNIRDGKLILRDDNDDWSIYTYDLRTEELTKVFSEKETVTGAIYSSPIYANHEYVVVCALTEDLHSYRVYKYGKSDPVLTLPESDENNRYFVNGTMEIVYDQLFFDGVCRLGGFNKTVPVIYRAYLSHGDTEVFTVNASTPRYGVCNVCFSINFNDLIGVYISDLRGDIFPSWDESSQTSTTLDDTYFPIRTRYIEDEILGSRTAISWLDKNSNSHEIGTTGFGYSTTNVHITRDGIFLMPLYHGNDSMVKQLLIGMYDPYSDTNRAALIPCQWRGVFTENNAIYYVDIATLETIMLSPHEEVFLYVDGENN